MTDLGFGNVYIDAMGRKLFERCPKTVLAAIAVSSMTSGGDFLDKASERIIDEWWALYVNGIVPQRPPGPPPPQWMPGKSPLLEAEVEADDYDRWEAVQEDEAAHERTHGPGSI